jgi:hypothetical protein
MQQQAQLNAEKAKEQTELENAASQREYRGMVGEARKTAAEAAKAGVEERTAKAKADAAEKLYRDQIKGRSVTRLLPGETPPPGWTPIQAPDGVTEYASPAMMKVPKELLDQFPGKKEGDVVTSAEFDEASKKYNDFQKAMAVAGAKPPAEKAKDVAQATMQKVAAAGALRQGAFSNLGELQRSINDAKAMGAIKDDEASNALAYYATNASPAASGSTATLRVEGMLERQQPMVDTNTDQILSMSTREINDANQREPGRYVQAGSMTPILQKEANFSDINYNIRHTKEKLQALGSIDLRTRAALAQALADPNPRSAVEAFVGGLSASALQDEKLQDAIIALRNLSENSLVIRQIGGMGQGSDALRTAIQAAVVPSARTPDLRAAIEQLTQAQQIVNNLHEGLPKTRKNIAAPSAPTQPPQKTYSQADVDAAVAAHPGLTPQQADAAFKAKGWTKK